MSPLLKGLLVATFQVALLGAVGGKLLYDRARLPRVWVETAGVDPDLPIRGRYIALNVVLPVAPESVAATEREVACGRIELRDDRAVAVLERDAREMHRPILSRYAACFRRVNETSDRWLLLEPVAFFLPEHARDPTLDAQAHELWAEITLLPKSAPRPIRLGVKRNDGIDPLD